MFIWQQTENKFWWLRVSNLKLLDKESDTTRLHYKPVSEVLPPTTHFLVRLTKVERCQSQSREHVEQVDDCGRLVEKETAVHQSTGIPCRRHRDTDTHTQEKNVNWCCEAVLHALISAQWLTFYTCWDQERWPCDKSTHIYIHTEKHLHIHIYIYMWTITT